MRTSQLRRVKEVFLRAQYHQAADREGAARAECGDDPEVLEDVLRLVRVQQQVESTPSAHRDAGLPSAGENESRPSTRTDAASSLETDAPRRGDVVLGRYEIRDALGAGAFGTVHLAYDRITRELVAVKAVRLTSARAVEWHVREIASLRKARVPGVVELLATGYERDRAFVIMAFVEGQPFPGVGVTEGDFAAILPRAVSLLEAVGHLHASGVYHRDLKPSNVLVSPAGHVTLVDFGIAQDETDALRWLPEATIAGTFTYMAPERLRGKRATMRSDLYAVGVMLVEALTGEAPVAGRALSSGAASEHERDDLTAALEAVVPPVVAKCVVSLVAHDPNDRPADAWAALDVLRAALGPQSAFELPRLGGDAAVRAVVEAALAGHALDVVGPPGSGRSRTLLDAERRLAELGLLAHQVRPQSVAERCGRPALRETAGSDLSPDDLDRDLCASLRRRVADGLVLLVDDFDALDAPTRGLVDSVRGLGAVIRVVADSDGPCVRLANLAAADLEVLVRGPERLFQARSEVAALLWKRTRGRPRDVAREVRSWSATGLAAWNGVLEVGPRQLDRIRASASGPQVAESSARLHDRARVLWNAMTLIGEPASPAVIAEVLQVPQRVMAGDLDELIARGLVAFDVDGTRVEIVQGSPFFADASPDERRDWSERAAALLPSRSEARFHHLVAAGCHEAACRAALDVASSQIDAGNVSNAIGVLDPALGIARRHVPQAIDLGMDLLAAFADAAISRGTRSAVDLALYHANLTPSRDRRAVAWSAILESAAAVLDSDARRALDLLDAAGDLPTEQHRRAAHNVGYLAARMTRSIDLQRRCTAAGAAWARRNGGERDARALLAAWTGWLRFEEGKYEAAYRLHKRAARLARRTRSRTTSLCDAAMSALEAGDLEAAASLASDALRAAQRGRDSVNQARAELLIRQCAYRGRRPLPADEDLLSAAAELDRGATRGMIRLTEASIAWRERRLVSAATLAADAADDLRASGFRTAAVLASALAAVCGGRADLELLALLRGAEPLDPVGIASQAVALGAVAVGTGSIPASQVARAREWARNAPRPGMPREVISPREAELRLDESIRG